MAVAESLSSNCIVSFIQKFKCGELITRFHLHFYFYHLVIPTNKIFDFSMNLNCLKNFIITIINMKTFLCKFIFFIFSENLHFRRILSILSYYDSFKKNRLKSIIQNEISEYFHKDNSKVNI